MRMNYQKYLMEIGVSPKLVKMAAVVKGIEMMEPQPTKEQIAVTDNGDILVMVNSTVTKFYLNGDEAVREEKKPGDELIRVTHIDNHIPH